MSAECCLSECRLEASWPYRRSLRCVALIGTQKNERGLFVDAEVVRSMNADQRVAVPRARDRQGVTPTTWLKSMILTKSSQTCCGQLIVRSTISVE